MKSWQQVSLRESDAYSAVAVTKTKVKYVALVCAVRLLSTGTAAGTKCALPLTLNRRVLRKNVRKEKKKESEPDGRVVKYLPLRARYAPILRANPLICYTITLCGYWGSLLSSLGRSKIRKQLSFLFLFRM